MVNLLFIINEDKRVNLARKERNIKESRKGKKLRRKRSFMAYSS